MFLYINLQRDNFLKRKEEKLIIRVLNIVTIVVISIILVTLVSLSLLYFVFMILDLFGYLN